MPKFPGVLLNNNPNAPSLDLNDLQVKGVGIFANVAERDALDANIQTEGYLSVMKDDDNVYIYKGGGWTTPANWEKISGTIGFTDSDGNPLGEVSTLVFPEGSISIVGTSGVVEFSAGGTSTDTTNFNGVLSSADTTVQAALDTLDGLSLTLEGLGDTPSGYGTAGQVLITNGVDGFTFGSGSPWEQVSYTGQTAIKYENGVVGIKDSAVSYSTNANLLAKAAQFPVDSGSQSSGTLMHLHEGKMIFTTDNSPTGFIGARFLGTTHATTDYGLIGLYNRKAWISGGEGVYLGAGGTSGISTYISSPGTSGQIKIGSTNFDGAGGIQLSGDTGPASNYHKIVMGGQIVFHGHTASKYVAISRRGSYGHDGGVQIGGGTKAGLFAHFAASDPNTQGTYGYLGINVNSPQVNGPAFEVSSSYAKFNNSVRVEGEIRQDVNANGTHNIHIGTASYTTNTNNNNILIGNNLTLEGSTSQNVLIGRNITGGSYKVTHIGTSGAGSVYIASGSGGSSSQIAIAGSTSNTSSVAIGGNSSIYSVVIGHASKAGEQSVVVGNSSNYSTALNYQSILGRQVARFQSAGDSNVFIGYRNSYGATNVSDTVSIGREAGHQNSTGNANVFIGYKAGYSETGSNKLYISNSNTTTPLIYGDFSTSTLRANGTLEIGDPASTGYAFPTATGTTGQILKVDANGDLVFGDDLNGLWTSDTNGITYAGHVGVDIASDVSFPLTVGGGVKVGGKLAMYSDAAHTAGNVIISHGNFNVNPSATSNNILIGGQVTATTSNSIIIGYNVTGSGQDLVIGSSTYFTRAVIGSNPGGIGIGAVGIFKAAALSYGVAIGQASNANVSGGVAIGLQARSGDGVAIGNRAGTANTATNTGNINIGVNAGHRYYNVGGQDFNNTVNIGYEAGRSMAYNTSITGNSVNIGYQTGYFAEGGNNVMIGYRAGYGVNGTSTGSGNVFLGNAAGYSETGSNKLYISNSNTTTPLIYGEFDNDILRVNGTLQINDPAATGYAFPTATGTQGQVLKVDANGDLVFGDDEAGLWTEDTNGITYTAGSVGIGTASVADYPLAVDGKMAIGYLQDSVIIGNGAGSNLTAANESVIIGHDARTTGSTNSQREVVIGARAISSQGIAIGYEAVGGAYGVTIGTGAGPASVAIGYGAGANNTNTLNTYVGNAAGNSITSGQANLILGHGADGAATNSGQTVVGAQAVSSGTGAIALGRLADSTSGIAIGQQSVATSGGISMGFSTGANLTTGTNNVFLGSGGGVTTGSDNTIVGKGNAPNLTTQNNNVIIGHDAVTGASWNFGNSVVIGYQAGQNVSGATGQGGGIFIGSNSGNWSQSYYGNNVNIGANSGNASVAIGEGAGSTGGGGLYGTIIGRNASGGGTVIGADAVGGGKVAIGHNASAAATQAIAIGGSANYQFSQAIGGTVNGNFGVAIGSNSAEANSVAIGYSLLSGSANTIQIGTFNAAYHSTQVSTGAPSSNILMGTSIVQHHPTANANAITDYVGNVFLGSNIASYPSGSLSSNVIIGQNAYSSGDTSYANETGSNNVIIGNGAGAGLDPAVSGSYTRPLSGNVIIGYQAAQEQAISNKLYIANSNTTTPLIYGDFSDGYVTINKNGTDKISFYAGSHAYQISDADYAGNFISGGVTNAKGLYILFEGTNLEQSGAYRGGGLLIGRAWNFGQSLSIANGVILGNRITATATSGNSWLPGVLIGSGVDLGSQNHSGGVMIGNFSPANAGPGVTIQSGSGTKPAAGTSNSVLINSTSGSYSIESVCIGGRAWGYNVSIGANAQLNATGNNPGVFIGRETGRYENGQNSTMVGSSAGRNINGGGNTLFGTNAGYGGLNQGNNSSRFNTAIGAQAIYSIDGGDYNTAVGHQAGYDLTSASNSVLIGSSAGSNITTGTGNVMVGEGAGTSVVTGSGNVMIGTRAGDGETGSNKLYVSSGQGSDLIYGEFDNELVKINGDLEATGSNGLTLTSPNGTRYKVTVTDAGALNVTTA